MFETLSNADKEYLSLLDPEGNLNDIPPQAPLFSDGEMLSAYRLMLLARQADDWAVSLNRQGRMATYPPNKGQEANAVGAVLALREDDWLVPAFRELGALIAKGIPLHQVYMYWYGNEQGSNLPPEIYHALPIAIPVGSQPLHAIGIAYAEKLKASRRIVLSFMGEGATSQGAVHEAFNLAGVWSVGVVFYIQNNQWAISLPTEKQTASRTLAEIQELIDLRRSEAVKRDLRIEHLRGGTFTLSNYGSIGGIYGRPMILPPQVAILGLGRIHQAPVAREGRLAVATILPLSLVFDHRVCDGSYAVRFLNLFIELVSRSIRIPH
jgi:hypothetical protein